MKCKFGKTLNRGNVKSIKFAKKEKDSGIILKFYIFFVCRKEYILLENGDQNS
jgi:hypothetical protein